MSDYERFYLLVSNTEEGTSYDSLIILYNDNNQSPEWIQLGETGNKSAEEHLNRLMEMENKNMYELISSGKVQFIDRKHQKKIQFLMSIFGNSSFQNYDSLIFDQVCLASTYLFGHYGLPIALTIFSNISVLFLPLLWMKSIFDLGKNIGEYLARTDEEKIGKRKGYNYSYLNLKKALLLFLYTTTFVNLVNVSTRHEDILKKLPDLVLARIESFLIDSDKNQLEDGTLPSHIEATLEKALAKNSFLDEEYREIVLDCFPMFTENSYLNIRETYRNLRVLSIHDHEERYKSKPSLAGTCISWYSLINTYNLESYTRSDREKILHHEIAHIMGDFLYCSCLTEGMNALLLEEYMQEYSYDDCAVICRMLCEIVGSDLMLEAYSKEMPDLINERLKQIDPTIKVRPFFERLDEMHTALYIDENWETEEYHELKKSNVETLLNYAEKAQLSEESYGAVLSYAEYLLGVSDTITEKRYFSEEDQGAMQKPERSKIFTKK